MSSSQRSRGKHKRSDDGEGSAARTRPFSFEEIMLRRRNKISSDDFKEGFVEPENAPRNGNLKSVSHNIEYEPKSISRKTGKSASTNIKAEENHLKETDRVTHVPVRRLKSVISRPNDDMDNDNSGVKTDKQVIVHRNEERGRRESNRISSYNDRNEGGKRNSRDFTELRRGSTLRESKRKYQNGDDEKNRDKNKKRLAERLKDSEITRTNKRKELSRTLPEESKRRGKSPSKRDHEQTSYNRIARRESSPRPRKDRSPKQYQSDKNKLPPGNGSSSKYRRHDEPKSGLGGYSPRKRITEAAAKTPPPIDHSSDKKNPKWDILPPENPKILSNSILSDFQLTKNIISMSVQDFGVSAATLLNKKLASVDSVQLTQATRPMRRLYVENLPSSTSEKDLVEWFNDLLLSSGINFIQGTQPCLNCIINKEKAQALVEFLTPEDASTALAFDGSSISGTVLKIRRPKNFVEGATGEPEKPSDAVHTVSDIVKDSPNKIFVGGISKALSSKMLMEIVSAFGPLKAYRFQISENLNEPCAFLEFEDQSVTYKACSGLNGMKLGGKVLTVVRAYRGEASLGNTGSSSYEIPDHAKPLLKQPTQILKLDNVFNKEGLSLLSEPEIEEMIDDIRLECTRFGNVKSVNIVKQVISQITDEETGFENDGKTNTVIEDPNGDSEGIESQDDDLRGENFVDGDITESKKSQTSPLRSDIAPQEFPDEPKSPKEISEDDSEKDSIPEDENRTDSGILENKKGDAEDRDLFPESVFEMGSVFVEFGRIEAACVAAHCLQGRVFDGRMVSVDYVPLNHYKARFPK